jgi:hypothetical protein
MNKSKVELVKELFSHLEKGEADETDMLLGDDFSFSGPTPEPVEKKRFMELHEDLLKAIPDWNFNAHDLTESWNKITLKIRQTGTHSEELNIPSLGIKAVRATNKCFSLPEEKVEVAFEGDKISSLKVEKLTNGGLLGIFSQLGIKMPVAITK